jgi:endonuclease/exonuclease/phosphatase family metal-dependent hydrolase
MTDTPSPLKLVTFNVHGWYDSAFAFNVPRVITILDKLQPDLVGIQEVLRQNNDEIHRPNRVF